MVSEQRFLSRIEIREPRQSTLRIIVIYFANVINIVIRGTYERKKMFRSKQDRIYTRQEQIKITDTGAIINVLFKPIEDEPRRPTIKEISYDFISKGRDIS